MEISTFSQDFSWDGERGVAALVVPGADFFSDRDADQGAALVGGVAAQVVACLASQEQEQARGFQ